MRLSEFPKQSITEYKVKLYGHRHTALRHHLCPPQSEKKYIFLNTKFTDLETVPQKRDFSISHYILSVYTTRSHEDQNFSAATRTHELSFIVCICS